MEFDNNLHIFEVTSNVGKVLGNVYPASLEDMEILIKDLDSGSNPINDSWEDGNGNTCNIDGWE